MIRLFVRYTSVGMVNTAIHWAVFVFLVYISQVCQAVANVMGFTIAVTFSYYANAKFTFKATTSKRSYFLYITFMGTLSAFCGALADNLKVNPLITLISFSIVSLLLGFLYSKFIVFNDKK